jgi:RHS repeat-associated protein
VTRNGSSANQTRSYNSLNQANGGSNTSSVDILGETDSSASVTIGSSSVVRQNNNTYFAGTVTGSNYYYPRWAEVTVVETKASGQTAATGHVLVPGPYPNVSYDFDGNQTANDMWTYTWDGENRLIKAETRWSVVTDLPKQRLEFAYDGGRRTQKKVSISSNGTTWTQIKLVLFAYDGWNLIAEWGALPTDLRLTRTHHWGIDVSGTLTGAGGVGGLVLTRHHDVSHGPDSYWPVMDNTGDVYALVNISNSEVGATYEYGPFGEALRSSGLVALRNPIRWSSKYIDEETMLVYYGYRYYDPRTARFLGRDRIEEQGGQNLLAFPENRPSDDFDYLGLKGNGHHMIPWSLFNDVVTKEVHDFFDSDLNRIFNDAYKAHNLKKICGITHDDYIEAVRDALKDFLGEKQLHEMTLTEAERFAAQIRNAPKGSTIGKFNRGIRLEASLSQKFGSAAFSKVAGAYRAALRKGGQKAAAKAVTNLMAKGARPASFGRGLNVLFRGVSFYFIVRATQQHGVAGGIKESLFGDPTFGNLSPDGLPPNMVWPDEVGDGNPITLELALEQLIPKTGDVESVEP